MNPDPDVVFGTGSHFAWGRRDDAFVIWRLKPQWKVVESFPPHHQLEALQLFLALEQRRRRWGDSWVRARMTWPSFEPQMTLAAGILAVAFIGFVIYVTSLRGVGGGAPSEGVVPQVQKGLSAPNQGAAMPSRPSGAASFPSSIPGVNVHVNDQAGYLFSYPDSWELSRSGETDELASPGEDIVMSFGVAPSGPLRQASDGVLGRLTDAYSDVELVSDRVERTEQGQRGLAIGATATDANGAFVRLMAIIIRGTDQNRAITIRFSASSDPLSALPAIRQIVASFRTSAVA